MGNIKDLILLAIVCILIYKIVAKLFYKSVNDDDFENKMALKVIKQILKWCAIVCVILILIILIWVSLQTFFPSLRGDPNCCDPF